MSKLVDREPIRKPERTRDEVIRAEELDLYTEAGVICSFQVKVLANEGESFGYGAVPHGSVGVSVSYLGEFAEDWKFVELHRTVEHLSKLSESDRKAFVQRVASRKLGFIPSEVPQR